MKVIIIGATGTIGKAVANAFADAGYETLEVSRNSNPSIDIDNAASVEKFFSQCGKADAVVCATGNATFGEIGKLTESDLQSTVNSKLLGQFRVVQSALKILNPGGTIIVTGGMLAYSPWPATSAVAMVNAGLEGLVRGAAKEITDDRKVVVMHPPLLAETAKYMNMDPAPWPEAAKVASAYLDVVRSAENGKAAFVKGYRP